MPRFHALQKILKNRVGWGKAPPLRSQRPTAEYIAHNKELSNAHIEAYDGNIKNDK